MEQENELIRRFAKEVLDVFEVYNTTQFDTCKLINCLHGDDYFKRKYLYYLYVLKFISIKNGKVNLLDSIRNRGSQKTFIN